MVVWSTPTCLSVFTPKGRTQLMLWVWGLHRPWRPSAHAMHAVEFELQRLASRLQCIRRTQLQGIVENEQVWAINPNF